jgi:hypothetical protein
MTFEIVRGGLYGDQIRIDLHSLVVPGTNQPAHRMSGPDLYRAMKRAKVTGNYTVNSGQQDLLWELGLYLRATNPHAVRRPHERNTQTTVKP